MPSWTSVDTHPFGGRTFQRPLGTLEHIFFLEGLFNGQTDLVEHYELRLSDRAVQDAHLFSDANVVRAWVSTKRRFPLAGATVDRGRTGTNAEEGNRTIGPAGINRGPHFVVREGDLFVRGTQDIVFGHVADAAEAQRRAAAIIAGPRLLSDESLAQLHVFREAGSESARGDVLHVMMLMSHAVADAMASRTLARCFFDTLARGGSSESEPTQMRLEDRMRMATSMEELEPEHLRTLSPAKRRWRRAIAAVMVGKKSGRKGGHTLPCHRTHSTKFMAARSGVFETTLTQAQTTDVIAKCRQHKITFGNAYVALAQVAMTRVLYRRYLRGEISEEEWAYRKKQPHVNQGPVNSRPYLDKGWFERGGGGEFMASINGYTYILPFMTLGGTDHQHRTKHAFPDGAPPFSDLLTFDRFLHRAGLVKKQAAVFQNHPLFFEMMCVRYQKFLAYVQFVALCKTKAVEAGNHNGSSKKDEDPASVDVPLVAAHVGSSFGNMDLILPFEYPLPPTHTLSPYSPVPHPLKAGYVIPSGELPPKVTPTIAVEYEKIYLQSRPGDLNLGALTWRRQLKLYVHFDSNVFDGEVVREWLDELREAVLWYLG